MNITPTEDMEQKALAQYLDLILLGYWFHVPNGGLRNIVVAKKLVGQGVKPGVPDNWIIKRPPNFPDKVGCVIELKRTEGGTVSREQKAWLERLSAEGWLVAVCKGFGKSKDFLDWCGYKLRA